MPARDKLSEAIEAMRKAEEIADNLAELSRLRATNASLAAEVERLKAERDELAKWASLALFVFPEAVNDVVESARDYVAEATACDTEDGDDLNLALEICGWDDLARTAYDHAERIIKANVSKEEPPHAQ